MSWLGRLTEVNQRLLLRFLVHGEPKVAHTPKSTRIIHGNFVQVVFVHWVDSSETEFTPSLSRLEKGSKDRSIQLVENKLKECRWSCRLD